MRIFVVFYRPQTIILTITTILMITHKFNANKKAHPPKTQKLSEDGLLLSTIFFLCLQMAKIPLKSNKKRRIGTISCILFCVLLCEETRKWCVNRGKNAKKVRNFPLHINIRIIYVYRKILPKSKNYLCRPI